MTKYIFQFHYEKKPDEIITWLDTTNISEVFKDFASTVKENKDDLIFYFKGSPFRYKDCEFNLSFKNRIISQVKPKETINIIVFSLKKTKKQISGSNSTTLKLSSSNERQELPSSEFISSEIPKEDKQGGEEIEETETSKLSSSNNKKLEEKEKEEKYYNDILCPNCLTSAIIQNDGYGLKIINCENFHRISNITYDRIEFLNSFPSAKCGICSGYRSQYTPPNNVFYNCICGHFICPDCYKLHSKEHNKIEIENKNFYCVMHRKYFDSYCLDCNMNLCESCSSSHLDHSILLYETLKPKDKEYISDIKKEIQRQINVVNNFIDTSRKICNDIIKEIESYIGKYILIEKTLVKKYKEGMHNFQLLQNLRNKKLFYENYIFRKLNSLNLSDKTNNLELLNMIYDIYDNVCNVRSSKNPIEERPKYSTQNEMTIKYVVKEKGINKKVKLFDSIFVDNNRDKLKIKINDDKDEKPLIEYYNNYNNKEEIIVTLLEKQPVTDMSYMFNKCRNLVAFRTDKWDTINITNMESIFQLCLFDKVPDISKWRTPSLTNMKGMFCKCINLKSMPEMSKWNTTNVKDMSLLFNGCISIEAIPRFPLWNTQNVEDMSYMFSRCLKLKDLHNIGKLNTEKVKNMSGFFNKCKDLLKLPDISKWNMTNVTSINTIFQFCSKVKTLPDISKWNLSNVKDMSGAFSECLLLKTLPPIGIWNTSKVESMSALFNGCCSLIEFPDISKWNISNVTDISGMFCDCQSITRLPNISEWNTSNVANMNYLFFGCSNLMDISPIYQWNIENVIDKTQIFDGCSKLNKNDIEDWYNCS